MYNTTRWRKFRELVLQLNPQCQRLVEDWSASGGHYPELVQCKNQATDVHHFESPRQRPALFTVMSNVAALCKHCHHKNQGETDKSGYVPTIQWKRPRGYTGTQNPGPLSYVGLKLRGVRRLLVFFSELARKLQKRERQRRLSPDSRCDSGRDWRLRSLQERTKFFLPLIAAEERRAETVDISHSGATVIVAPMAWQEFNFVLGQLEVQ
jgi:hypothetical protein